MDMWHIIESSWILSPISRLFGRVSDTIRWHSYCNALTYSRVLFIIHWGSVLLPHFSAFKTSSVCVYNCCRFWVAKVYWFLKLVVDLNSPLIRSFTRTSVFLIKPSSRSTINCGCQGKKRTWSVRLSLYPCGPSLHVTRSCKRLKMLRLPQHLATKMFVHFAARRMWNWKCVPRAKRPPTVVVSAKFQTGNLTSKRAGLWGTMPSDQDCGKECEIVCIHLWETPRMI